MANFLFLYLHFKGWFEKFKKRNNISSKTVQGESLGIDYKFLEEGRTRIKNITESNHENDRNN